MNNDNLLNTGFVVSAFKKLQTEISSNKQQIQEELFSLKESVPEVGPVGPKGDPGEKGLDGKDGEKGDTGPQGKKGNTGAQGPKGLDGVKGDTGEAGADGQMGPIGDTGPKGETGPQGDTGEPGPQGEIGPQGIQGEKGLDGKDGKDGLKGDTGPQGPIGLQGPQGEIGPKGDTGLKGDTGPQGLIGPKGDTGPQGEKGLDGKDGVNGKDGINGKDGVDGKDGKDGTDYTKEMNEFKSSLNESAENSQQHLNEFVAKTKLELKAFEDEMSALFNKQSSKSEKSLEDLYRKFDNFSRIVNLKLGEIGGGGSVRILENDDVEFQKRHQVEGDAILIFDADKKKFVSQSFGDIAERLRIGMEKQYDKLIDVTGTANEFTYVGEADPGSARNAPLWRIKRIYELGDDIEIMWADNTADFTKVWDDRLTYEYN